MPGLYIIMVFGFHLLNFGLCKVLLQDAMEYSESVRDRDEDNDRCGD